MNKCFYVISPVNPGSNWFQSVHSVVRHYQRTIDAEMATYLARADGAQASKPLTTVRCLWILNSEVGTKL